MMTFILDNNNVSFSYRLLQVPIYELISLQAVSWSVDMGVMTHYDIIQILEERFEEHFEDHRYHILDYLYLLETRSPSSIKPISPELWKLYNEAL